MTVAWPEQYNAVGLAKKKFLAKRPRVGIPIVYDNGYTLLASQFMYPEVYL
jgi:hypothetical protein